MGSALCALSHGNFMSCRVDMSCGSDMSKEIPHLAEMPCMEKSISTKEFSKSHVKYVWRGVMQGHVFKNENAIERYCISMISNV